MGEQCDQCYTPFSETEGQIHTLEYVTEDNAAAHVCDTCWKAMGGTGDE